MSGIRRAIVLTCIDTGETEELYTVWALAKRMGICWTTAKRMLGGKVVFGHKAKAIEHRSTKVCSKCKVEKEWDQFTKGASWCRDCTREDARRRYRLANGLPSDHPIQHKLALMKRCPRCKQKKVRLKDFYVFTAANGRTYAGGYCKVCEHQKHKEYNAAKKDSRKV